MSSSEPGSRCLRSLHAKDVDPLPLGSLALLFVELLLPGPSCNTIKEHQIALLLPQTLQVARELLNPLA